MRNATVAISVADADQAFGVSHIRVSKKSSLA